MVPVARDQPGLDRALVEREAQVRAAVLDRPGAVLVPEHDDRQRADLGEQPTGGLELCERPGTRGHETEGTTRPVIFPSVRCGSVQECLRVSCTLCVFRGLDEGRRFAKYQVVSVDVIRPAQIVQAQSIGFLNRWSDRAIGELAERVLAMWSCIGSSALNSHQFWTAHDFRDRLGA